MDVLDIWDDKSHCRMVHFNTQNTFVYNWKIFEVCMTWFTALNLSVKNSVKKFQWCPFHPKPTVITGICLLLINSCGSTASWVLETSIQWKAHPISIISVVWSQSWNVLMIELYINIWNNTSFCKKVTWFQLQTYALPQSTEFGNWPVLNQISHKVTNGEGFS